MSNDNCKNDLNEEAVAAKETKASSNNKTTKTRHKRKQLHTRQVLISSAQQSANEEELEFDVLSSEVESNVNESAELRKESSDQPFPTQPLKKSRNYCKDHPRKKISIWSDAECEHLVAGYMMYGNNWISILEHFPVVFANRNRCDLLSKHKSLSMRGKLSEYEGMAVEIYEREKDHVNQNPKTKDEWTDDELCHLLAGVQLFGTDWKTILGQFPLIFKSRNSIGLKDKHYLLKKHQLLANIDQERVQVIVEQNKNVVPSKSCNSRWDSVETAYLVAGVDIYGEGRWAKILRHFYAKFNQRSPHDLYARWRHLLKSDQIKEFRDLNTGITKDDLTQTLDNLA